MVLCVSKTKSVSSSEQQAVQNNIWYTYTIILKSNSSRAQYILSEEISTATNMDVVNHITQNFVLYGLGSDAQAIFQTVRELVENSKDAIHAKCSTLTRKDKKIQITLRNDESCLEEVCIEVSDSGIGMEDPLNCLKFFTSSRSAEETQVPTCTCTSGKYGIGLSACILYSQTKCNRETVTKIVSKSAKDCFLQELDVKFDLATGQPISLRLERQHSMTEDSGSTIKISLPKRLLKQQLRNVLNDLRMYLNRLLILPTNDILTVLSVNILTASHSPEHSQISCNETRATVPIEDASDNPGLYRARYKEHLLSTFSDTENLRENQSCKLCFVGHTSASTGLTGSIGKSAQTSELTVSLVLITEKQSPGLQKPNAIKIKILRYVNGAPLAESSNESISCVMFRSVSGNRHLYKSFDKIR